MVPMLHSKWPNQYKVIKATAANLALIKGTHSYRTREFLIK